MLTNNLLQTVWRGSASLRLTSTSLGGQKGNSMTLSVLMQALPPMFCPCSKRSTSSSLRSSVCPGLKRSVYPNFRHSVCPSLKYSACPGLLSPSSTLSLFKHTDSDQLSKSLAERARFLSKTFSGSEEEVRQYLMDHPHLLTMGIAKFQRISKLLREHGISLREIMTYPEVYKRKFETLRSRIKKLQDGGIEKVTLTMINTTWSEYHKKSRRLIQDQETREEYGSLVELLSRRLHIAPDIAANITSQHLWLQQSKLSTIKEKLDVLDSYGVPPGEVEARPWVLALASEELEEQLLTLREEGLPYGSLREGVAYLSLVKLSPQKFPRTLARRQQEREILGECRTTAQYLRHRLGCSEEDVRERMLRSNHHLLAVSPHKLRAVLDFVLGELGLPARDVVAHAKVFSFGLPRLRQRLLELGHHGIPPSVQLLALDSRSYRRLMERLELQKQASAEEE